MESPASFPSYYDQLGIPRNADGSIFLTTPGGDSVGIEQPNWINSPLAPVGTIGSINQLTTSSATSSTAIPPAAIALLALAAIAFVFMVRE